MKISLIIVCFMGFLSLKAQDTICKLSGECFVAEVRLQNRPFENRSKIVFRLPGEKKAGSVEKKDLSYIRFKNGQLDVFKSDLKFSVDTHEIYITKQSLIYKGAKISNKGVLNLITDFPYVEKRESLLKEHTKLRRNNRNRVVWGILGISYTAIGILLVASHELPAMAATLLGAGAVCISISQICNYRYHVKKKHIVASYNTF